LTRDIETFGKMDPFVQITYNGNTYKTPTHQDGGKAPKWNHTIEIPICEEKD
jgi:Ca2+-dependent lipid-binding protein